MEKKRVLINPRVRWAIEPTHNGTLRQIDGLGGPVTRLPEIGEVLTLPFIVDATSGRPCPVRVTRIEYQDMPGHTLVIPVLVPAQPS